MAASTCGLPAPWGHPCKRPCGREGATCGCKRCATPADDAWVQRGVDARGQDVWLLRRGVGRDFQAVLATVGAEGTSHAEAIARRFELLVSTGALPSSAEALAGATHPVLPFPSARTSAQSPHRRHRILRAVRH